MLWRVKYLLKLSPVIPWKADKAPIEPVTLEEKVGNRMVVVEFLFLAAFSQATIDWFARRNEKEQRGYRNVEH